MRITIEDGGPNDGDHEINGVIVDPSVLMGDAAPTPYRRSGSVGLWSLIGLLALAASRRRFPLSSRKS